MTGNKRRKCLTCGRTGSTRSHRCPPAIAREDWTDVAGSQSRFVVFGCPCCGEQVTTKPVNPAQQPASMYGVGQYKCGGCEKVGEALFRQWPMRPKRVGSRERSRRGWTYGT